LWRRTSCHADHRASALAKSEPARANSACGIRRPAGLGRALARVLDGEEGGQHQHVFGGPVAMLACRDDHPTQRGVDWQARELAADVGQAALVVERAQFEQVLARGGQLARVRRLDEGKVLGPAESQRIELQQHRGEVAPEDLRVGEGRALLEVLFLVEADAHARGDPTAAPGALVGRGLRDRFDAEFLQPGARVVTVDARHARVDHVVDAGHGQRGLGNVGREHDAPPGVRGEHALLVGGRQARVQRQDLGVPQAVARELALGLADLALARQEHQDVARALVDQLVDRVQHAAGDGGA